jgi:hypothetical protein
MNNKIRNISLLCTLLSVGSAAANPGPILSEDGTTFQLNFPPVIVDKLKGFIDGIGGHEGYKAFSYEIESGSLELIALDQNFFTTAEAMVPYMGLPWDEIQTRLQKSNVIGVCKTLLEINDKKAVMSANTVSAFCIKTILNYLFDQAAGCASTCCGPMSFLMRKIKFGQQAAEAIDDYIFHLDKIIQTPLLSEGN